jgi:outer membrane biosynthesis protein TonB
MGPIFGSIWDHGDGSVTITLQKIDHYRIRVWPGRVAAIIKQHAKGYTEAFATGVHGAPAWMSAVVRFSKHSAQKTVTTNYSSGVVRHDLVAVNGEGVNRTTQWKYPEGTQVQAKYLENSRHIKVLAPNEEQCGEFVTNLTGHGDHFETATHHRGSQQAVEVLGMHIVGIGHTAIHPFPDSSWYTRRAGAQDPGQMLTGMRIVTQHHDGEVVEAQVFDWGKAVHYHHFSPLGRVSTFMYEQNPRRPPTGIGDHNGGNINNQDEGGVDDGGHNGEVGAPEQSPEEPSETPQQPPEQSTTPPPEQSPEPPPQQPSEQTPDQPTQQPPDQPTQQPPTTTTPPPPPPTSIPPFRPPVIILPNSTPTVDGGNILGSPTPGRGTGGSGGRGSNSPPAKGEIVTGSWKTTQYTDPNTRVESQYTTSDDGRGNTTYTVSAQTFRTDPDTSQTTIVQTSLFTQMHSSDGSVTETLYITWSDGSTETINTFYPRGRPAKRSITDRDPSGSITRATGLQPYNGKPEQQQKGQQRLAAPFHLGELPYSVGTDPIPTGRIAGDAVPVNRALRRHMAHLNPFLGAHAAPGLSNSSSAVPVAQHTRSVPKISAVASLSVPESLLRAVRLPTIRDLMHQGAMPLTGVGPVDLAQMFPEQLSSHCRDEERSHHHGEARREAELLRAAIDVLVAFVPNMATADGVEVAKRLVERIGEGHEPLVY